ncbi:MAG TPA: thioredoxin domain-containing protein [Dongiaceae bacterium]|nr:thioredoxin domain-containing protein [Dongiaceae bacterium]
MLQKAIEDASNDRAALVKNLEAFLKQYPQSAQRPQIYRALVEACMQLRDFTRAVDYAERLVALNPEDISNSVLTIQLLDRYGDVPGYRRAVFYCSRVLEYVDHQNAADKSKRVSLEEWESSKNRDRSNLLMVRGGLYQKLHDVANAEKDFEASYALLPTSAAAERMGELAETRHDLNAAILQYARAFALADGAPSSSSRSDLRKKLGNAWRLAHGSEDGLGEYLLRTYDDVAASGAKKAARNPNTADPYDYTLRRVTDGSSVRFADAKGKVAVLNFWATWCGPCRALEPLFDRVAAHYVGRNDVVFYALNCDDDESLVRPYLATENFKTPAMFADGLDRVFRVENFPTTLILDRTGKIAFRADGFDSTGFEKSLTDAIDQASTPPATAAVH